MAASHDESSIPLQSYASAYAGYGWPVLPVEPGGKAPAGALVPHGVKDATTDPETLCRWFGAAAWNIGIACGKAAGFFVVDVDPRNGGGDALAGLEAKHGALPDTLPPASE